MQAILAIIALAAAGAASAQVTPADRAPVVVAITPSASLAKYKNVGRWTGPAIHLTREASDDARRSNCFVQAPARGDALLPASPFGRERITLPLSNN